MLLAIVLLLSACHGGYVVRQSVSHLQVLSARQKVDRAVAEGQVPDEWIPQIEIIGDARSFGVERLGLPADNLYRTISLFRPEPTWVVTASAKDALDPVTWKFPITGRVAYRGYYQRAGADKLAERLKQEGYDVLVSPVDAFSTLGWFADPIRPAMLDRSEASLVNLVLHEAAHRVVYYKGQTDFNESFASFVGDTGTLLYLEDRHGPDCEACRQTVAVAADARTFSAFVEGIVAELEELYARPLTREEKIDQREQVFDRARERFANLDWEGRTYSWFPGSRLDNAVILSLRRYEGDRQTFAELLDHCDGDLARSIEMVRALRWNKVPKKARESTTPFRLLSERIASRDCPATTSRSEVAIEEGDPLHPVADRSHAPVVGADGVRIEAGGPG